LHFVSDCVYCLQALSTRCPCSSSSRRQLTTSWLQRKHRQTLRGRGNLISLHCSNCLPGGTIDSDHCQCHWYIYIACNPKAASALFRWKWKFEKPTHARLTALCPGLPGWASTRKVKPVWILLKQETVSGSHIYQAVKYKGVQVISFR